MLCDKFGCYMCEMCASRYMRQSLCNVNVRKMSVVVVVVVLISVFTVI